MFGCGKKVSTNKIVSMWTNSVYEQSIHKFLCGFIFVSKIKFYSTISIKLNCYSLNLFCLIFSLVNYLWRIEEKLVIYWDLCSVNLPNSGDVSQNFVSWQNVFQRNWCLCRDQEYVHEYQSIKLVILKCFENIMCVTKK